jgi:hypothetical protein
LTGKDYFALSEHRTRGKAPELRRAAGGNASPGRDIKNKPFENIEAVADLQALRVARLYAVSYATAATIARLAYGVAPR